LCDGLWKSKLFQKSVDCFRIARQSGDKSNVDKIRAVMSFAMVPLGRHGDASAVHEDDLPSACLSLEESRFQRFLVHGAGGICNAAFIDIGNPSGFTADVYVGSVTFHS
jgi:hypothetical protein